MQDATENCHYPELVGEPLRLELNFTFPLEHVTELIVTEHLIQDCGAIRRLCCEPGVYSSFLI